MARRGKRVEHDNNDRWLISYADFITLLFAFFVVMYSISSLNESKYQVFSDSLSQAFLNQSNPAPIAVAPDQAARNRSEQMLKTLVDQRTARLAEQQRKTQQSMLASGISQIMLPMIQQGLVSVGENKRGVVIDISASSLFRTGGADLQPEALHVLRQVAVLLGSQAHPIEVEGHTDDVPIKTAQFPSNWELSSARASSMVRMLANNGVPAQRLSVVGLASNQPLAANDSPENRARNRRITILILSPEAMRRTTVE